MKQIKIRKSGERRGVIHEGCVYYGLERLLFLQEKESAFRVLSCFQNDGFKTITVSLFKVDSIINLWSADKGCAIPFVRLFAVHYTDLLHPLFP